jgi:hypothetical protein
VVDDRDLAAEALALNDRAAPPGLGQATGERRAGLAGADDDRVEPGGHRGGSYAASGSSSTLIQPGWRRLTAS